MTASFSARVRGGVLVAALGLLGVGAWLAAANGDDRPETLGDDVAEAPTSPATAPRRRDGCRFEAGEAGVWRLTVRHQLEANPEALLPFGARKGGGVLRPTPLSTLDVGLSLVAREATDPARGTVLAARLHGDVGPDETRRTDLSPTFLLRLGPDCAMEAFARHRDADLGGARAQQRMLLALQWSLPRQGESDRFVRAQRDGLGKLQARQVRADLAEGATLHRRVLRYTHLHGATQRLGPQPRVELGPGTSRVRLGAGPWCEAIDIDSDLTIYEDDRPALHDRATITLRRDESVEGRALVEAEARAARTLNPDEYVWGDLFGVDIDTSGHAAAVPGLAGMPLAGALDEFRRLRRDPTASQPSDTVRFLQQWLRANPDQAAALVDAIQKGDLDGELATLALLALKMSATPQARQALRAAMLDPDLAPEHRASALFGLADMDHIDADTFATLQALSRRTQGDPSPRFEVERAATLALGMLANPRLGHSPEHAEAARQELLDQLGANPAPERLGELLEGVGNSGETSMFSAIQPYQDATSADVRLAAAHALRMMDPATTQQTFVHWLAAEQDAEVRAELVKSMVGQLGWHGVSAPPAVIAAAAQQLPSEQGPVVVRALVSLLGPRAEQDATARAALVQLFKTSKDDQVLVQIGSHVAPKWLH